jgi:hypothetical protein
MIVNKDEPSGNFKKIFNQDHLTNIFWLIDDIENRFLKHLRLKFNVPDQFSPFDWLFIMPLIHP